MTNFIIGVIVGWLLRIIAEIFRPKRETDELGEAMQELEDALDDYGRRRR